MADNILHELLQLETPWKWNIPIPEEIIEQFIMRNTEKCSSISEESDFQWTTITLHILLAYECLERLKDSERALGHINACEQHLDGLTKANCNEPLFVAIKKALWHVVFATKGYILYFSHLPKENIQNLIMKAKTFNPTLNRDQAGILGIKAGVCIQYGTPGHRLALGHAKQAVTLDSDQAEWHFIVGNCLGRIRRIENERCIGKEEMAAIEKAFLLEKNASYIVHLAQLYAETSSYFYYNAYNDKEKLNKSNTYALKAIERYREATTLRPNCCSLMARVAHGLLRIRNRKDLDIAYIKGLLDKVETMAPNNSMVYHDLGFYYEKFENNIEKALLYLNKAHEQGNIKAFLSLTALKWRHGLTRQIIQDVKEALKKYPESRAQAELLTHLGACYLLIEDNMDIALKYFNEALSVDSKYLQNYPGFKGQPTNLLVLVTNKIRKQSFPSNNSVIFIEKTKLLVSSKDSKINTNLDFWKKEQWKLARGMNKAYRR